jgi:hypothetical protein
VHRILRRTPILRDLHEVNRTTVRVRTRVRIGPSQGANDAETYETKG